MASKRLSVVVTRRLPEAVETRLSELFDVTLRQDDTPMTREELVAALQTADVLVPTLTDRIDSGLIGQAGDRLRLIANYGAGVDHIDVGTARTRGILVSNTPGVVTEDTADMVMALIIAVPRRLAEGEKLLRSGQWKGWSPSGMLGHRIGGKTLGIIGMGRIGQAVALRAAPFGLSIQYHNRQRLPESVERATRATWVESLDDLISTSDFVSINCPLNDDSRSMIDARRIGLLKPDAYLINASRAEVYDEEALIEALQAGRIGGAGLDVFAHEPAVDERLLSLSNVVIKPHMGSATFEGREATGDKVIANIRTWVDGHRPRDQVLEGLF